MQKSYILGVDLAQSSDYTALTILECDRVDTGKQRDRRDLMSWSFGHGGPRVRSVPVETIYENHYAIRHLERLPIGTPYPAQVARIEALSDRLRTETGTAPLLVADATGVGRPVVDMLRTAELSPAAVTITGGDTVSQDGDNYRVPKRDLVSTTKVLLDSDRLTVAERLKERATLIAELAAFKVSISLKGHDSYGNDVGPWRENPHDDMVLAVALACWYGENYKPVTRPEPMSFSFSSF